MPHHYVVITSCKALLHSRTISVPRVHPLPQRHCDVWAVAYSAVFTCASNKRDTSLNTYSNECTDLFMCGFVGLEHFATVGHTATLFLYEYIKTQCFHLLFVFPVAPVSPSLLLPPTLKTHRSTWQRHCNFILLIM
jgi:hypothetical protein